MKNITILHGSDHIIEKPEYLLGKINNDYGRGFYCTQAREIAREWACKGNNDGYVNEYILDLDGLNVLNLLDGNHTVLNWIALLLKNRQFSTDDGISLIARNYIIDNFSIDLTNYDVVIGYRADDSYFSYAQSFIANTLPLRVLNEALKLGELGVQIVLVSNKAFNQIKFNDVELVRKNAYYPKYDKRDTNAREMYKKHIKKSSFNKNDIFVLDILREDITGDDPRI